MRNLYNPDFFAHNSDEVSDMKKLELALLLGMAGAICFSSVEKAADARQSLRENVLRLHILANSDSIDDQALKLKVRDRLLDDAEKFFRNPGDTLEKVEQSVTEHLLEIEWIAEQVVKEEGYDYDVTAELTEMPFDDRTYGELTMPAGTYDALRITIGEAKGQNWWCVMYPALCVSNAMEVDSDQETAEESFDAVQQDLLEHPERYCVKLKCAEWFEKFRNWFS